MIRRQDGTRRIGVFVCHCGLNIAASVDVEKVVEEISHYPGVVATEHYMYMCSDPGQDLVRKTIQEKKLDAIVMSNCSPYLHERTYRTLAASEGLNPYFCEVANIREACSWPHLKDREGATKKAIAIIKATVEKVRINMELFPPVIPLTRRALIVGAGIAGMTSALEIADAGYEVVLVDRAPYIGGHVSQLSGTFPTLDRVGCVTAPLLARVVTHPKIKLYTYSEIEDIEGYIGSFDIRIRKKASFVDETRCNSCGRCLEVCPVSVPSEFDRGLSQRGAIYRSFPEAVPSRLLIDATSCVHLATGNSCRACEEVCPAQAIEFTQEDVIAEERIGAIIVATGYDLFPRERIGEYEIDPDVIDGIQFERLLSPTGPTKGEIRRPSDGKVPQQVVFIQCVGSRDPEHGVIYCSRVCCMYTAKQAVLYKRAVPEGQAYVFYMDIRSDSKEFEEFVCSAVEEERIMYLRGRVSKVFRDGDKIKVWGADTLTGKMVEISADLVVLALGMTPSPGIVDLAHKLNVIFDLFGFITEAHPKLRPVETLTAGVYLAGACQWPKDIPDTISSASGAASKILSLFSREELLRDPLISFVDEEICRGCGQCVSVCVYKAITLDPKKKVATVNEAVCEGCGACAATCPSGAIRHKNSTRSQFFEMIDIAAAEYV